MDDNKQILYNYLIAKNNKIYDTLNNSSKGEKVENNYIDNIGKTENEYNNDLNLNNSKKDIIDKNNRNEKKLELSLSNKMNNESKELLVENSINKDGKKEKENINNLYSKKNDKKEIDNDYNKCFKNRMDMMQAVLDDELNISSDNNNFIRRRTKSRTTVKQNKKGNDKIKNLKENGNDLNKNIDKNNMKIYKNEFKEIKEIQQINAKNKSDDNEIEKIIMKNEAKIEDNDKIKKILNLNNIFDSPIKKENKNNKISNNINKISEEINFEIFNEKQIKSRKGSYININFSNKSIYKNNSKIDLGKRKNSQMINENNFSHLNKLKNNFNRSYMNSKENKNNHNLIKDYSTLPLSKKYFHHIKRSIDNNKIIPYSLDKLINKNKNKKAFENNNFKSKSITQKLNDIKQSLEKMSDIKREKIISEEKNIKLNIDKEKLSFNDIYFNILNDSYHPVNKIFSKNFISSKKTDSYDFILYNNKEKIENKIYLTSQKKTKKTNSYSNIYTLNNSPIHYNNKNRNFFNINNININNIRLIGKSIKLRNAFGDLNSNNLLNNINISESGNSKGFKDDNIIKNKRELKNRKNNSTIRLYYTYEKIENKNNSTKNLNKINISNFEAYNQKNQIKEELKNLSKNNDKKSTEYFKKRNIYKKENEKNNDAIKNNLNQGKVYYMFNNNLKYQNQNFYINDKNDFEKNKKIEIYNYAKKSKDIYSNKQIYLKDIETPFEKIRKKRIHSILPMNPFFNLH